MSNSPARNQFLLDCANADITPTMAAAELRSLGMIRLDSYVKNRYIAVAWNFHKNSISYRVECAPDGKVKENHFGIDGKCFIETA